MFTVRFCLFASKVWFSSCVSLWAYRTRGLPAPEMVKQEEILQQARPNCPRGQPLPLLLIGSADKRVMQPLPYSLGAGKNLVSRESTWKRTTRHFTLLERLKEICLSGLKMKPKITKMCFVLCFTKTCLQRDLSAVCGVL